jgi:hypothetical protein
LRWKDWRRLKQDRISERMPESPQPAATRNRRICEELEA